MVRWEAKTVDPWRPIGQLVWLARFQAMGDPLLSQTKMEDN